MATVTNISFNITQITHESNIIIVCQKERGKEMCFFSKTPENEGGSCNVNYSLMDI